MTKYQTLIKKIHLWQQDPHYSTFNFSPAEVELIAEALETIQLLEKIFEVRKCITSKKTIIIKNPNPLIFKLLWK